MKPNSPKKDELFSFYQKRPPAVKSIDIKTEQNPIIHLPTISSRSDMKSIRLSQDIENEIAEVDFSENRI